MTGTIVAFLASWKFQTLWALTAFEHRNRRHMFDRHRDARARAVNAAGIAG
jgi:hypothetical protein